MVRAAYSGSATLFRRLLCFQLWVAMAFYALNCVPCTAQSVTYGGPIITGVPTAIGGVTSSVSLLNIVSPAGIATDKLGNFYITDSTGNAVYSFNQAIAGNPPVYTPLGFNGLKGPAGVAVDASGNIFVADSGNGRVVELSASGAQSVPFSTSGSPIGVAVDGAGNLYVSVLLAPTAAGSVVRIAAGTNAPSGVGSGLSDPQGLAVDSSGNLYIADNQNDRIVEILAADGSQQTVVTGLNDPSHVAVDSAGDIFTDGAGGYVVEVKADTSDQVAVLPSMSGEYTGLSVDGNGNLFAVSAPTPNFYESNTSVIPLPSANVCQPGGFLQLPAAHRSH